MSTHEQQDRIEKIAAATQRQRAAYGSSIKTPRPSALRRLVNRNRQQRKDRNPTADIHHQRHRDQKARQPHHTPRSNPHSNRVHSATSHRLRGFLPWALSVACF